MNAPTFDFRALLPEPDGRDAELLTLLFRFNELRVKVEAARRRGKRAHAQAVRAVSVESLNLADRIAATTAKTAAGRHAKAMAALRYHDANPDEPSGGFTGYGAIMTASALFDIVQAGEEL